MSKSLKSKPQITLIILTYQRHDFIRRQLLYYASYAVHLIFADGSDERWEHEDKGVINGMSWDYIYFPGYDTYRERLHLALEKVDTDYVCLLDDQECILWSGLIAAINTLENNPDHSCAGGLASIYDSSNHNLTAWKGFSKLDLTHSDALNRFSKIVGPEHLSANLVYQVMRVSDLNNFSRNMRNHTGNSTATHEVALSGFLALKGKYLSGQYPYWIRNGGTVPVPEDFEVIITRDEIKRLASKLLDMLNFNRSGESNNFISIENLIAAIEIGWGPSSKWALDSKKYLQGIRSHNKSIVQMLRTISSSFIKTRTPQIYQAYKTYKRPQINGVYSFLEYAKLYSNNSYEVIRDLLLLEIIWKSFPNGIPSEFWQANS